MAKHKDDNDNLPPPPGKVVYPVPATDSSGERTSAGVSPSAQVPGKAPEETKGKKEETPLAAQAIAAVDAELVELRKRVAELEAEKATKSATGEGKKTYTVSHAGFAEKVVKADSEDGARQAYKQALGVWALPGDCTVVEGDTTAKE